MCVWTVRVCVPLFTLFRIWSFWHPILFIPLKMAYSPLAVSYTYKAARWQFIIFYFVRKKSFGKERQTTHTHKYIWYIKRSASVTTIQWIREPSDAKVSTMQHTKPAWRIKWRWIWVANTLREMKMNFYVRIFRQIFPNWKSANIRTNEPPIFRWVPLMFKLLHTHTLRHTLNANSSYGFSLTRRSSFIHHAFSYRIFVVIFFCFRFC